jgi:aerobic-type carbon monoxide dehydrogenase small subunit (CoxS/CutS family)
MDQRTILFVLVYKNEEYPVQVADGQYHSLMSLISDQLGIPGFGLCCGMGSCGTCLVTIYPAGWQTFACAVAVNDELANVRVLIEEARY